MASATTTVSIPAPRERHDGLLRESVAPLVRELANLPALDAVYFDRVNKPDWGLRIRIHSGDSDLHEDARRLVRRRLESTGQPFAFVDDEAEDKWFGGPAEEAFLKRIHHADSAACLDLLDLEARAALSTSRAQWSLLAVEGLLDLFGIHGALRLDFYRRGFEWAPALGRWDAEVFAVLEAKFEAQAGALRDAIALSADRHRPDVWGGTEAALIAGGFLAAARAPVSVALEAASSGGLEKAPIDVALFLAHAHSNRLGIHATQEATIRYLIFRARGGESLQAQPGGPASSS